MRVRVFVRSVCTVNIVDQKWSLEEYGVDTGRTFRPMEKRGNGLGDENVKLLLVVVKT